MEGNQLIVSFGNVLASSGELYWLECLKFLKILKMPIRLACQFFMAQSNIYSFLSCFAVYHLLAITVMFTETTYSVNEGDGSAQIGLVLSNPSSTDTTVQVFNTDGSTTGEYCSILINVAH